MASRASVSVRTWPSSSMRVRRSPSGSMHRAQLGARRAHQVADLAGVLVAVEAASTPAVEANGLTARTSAPSLASTLGMANEVEP